MTLPAAEFLYDSCTCDSGMRDGKRCADCGGRGIVIKGAPITGKTVEEEAPNDVDELENLSVTDLRTKAKELGLPTGGTKAALVERIRELSDETDDDDTDEEEDEADSSSG